MLTSFASSNDVFPIILNTQKWGIYYLYFLEVRESIPVDVPNPRIFYHNLSGVCHDRTAEPWETNHVGAVDSL